MGVPRTPGVLGSYGFVIKMSRLHSCARNRNIFWRGATLTALMGLQRTLQCTMWSGPCTGLGSCAFEDRLGVLGEHGDRERLLKGVG